ncbi:MAG TPA: hypothetical protein VHS35_22730 [Pseudonocardia sp.]|nr:hypothetical protein [Pseudonocardia sp.]
MAEQLYGLHPDAFVPARDDAVAEARQAGDRDLARAIARLRRPTRAAWLANLLARERPDQLDGLLALAGDLASAQRTLDGNALRALSAQRNRLVTAMAREGGRLAAQAGDSATESVVRDLAGILDAALADPAVADEVRSGRLTRTVSYSGFGPGPGGAGQQAPARDRAGAGRGAAAGDDGRDGGRGERSGDADAGGGKDEQERAEREKAERKRAERAERERAVEEAERAADEANERQESADADRADAESAHEAAKAQVADLTAELEAARERERAAAATARAATATARDAAREAATAAARADRARGRLAELDPD